MSNTNQGNVLLPDEIKTQIEIQKENTEACEICHRNFSDAGLVKCAKQLTFPADADHFMIVCSDCNYRMFKNEIKNNVRLEALCDETLVKLSVIARDFCDKRNDIISDVIVDVVGANNVSKRPKMDLLYKYPNWHAGKDDSFCNAAGYYEQLYGELIDLAKKTKVWNGSSIDSITSSKIQRLRKEKRDAAKLLKKQKHEGEETGIKG